jgi:hypothetical protein
MAERDKKAKTLKSMRGLPASVRMEMSNEAFAKGEGSEGVVKKLSKQRTLADLQAMFKARESEIKDVERKEGGK